MNTVKKLLPHLAVSFSLATLVVAILNTFNPRMGFLQSTQALVLIILTSVFCVATALLYITEQFSDTAATKDSRHRSGRHVR